MDTVCAWIFCTTPAWDNLGEIRISITCQNHGFPYLVCKHLLCYQLANISNYNEPLFEHVLPFIIMISELHSWLVTSADVRKNRCWITPDIINETSQDKTNKMTCAPTEDANQPDHQPSLIRVFWLDGCPDWFESSMGARDVLLVLSCGSSFGISQIYS